MTTNFLGQRHPGIAAPLLKAASISPEKAVGVLKETIEELKTAMFCAGCSSLEDLKKVSLIRGDC